MLMDCCTYTGREWDNRQRRHAKLGNLSPAAFQIHYYKTKAA